MGGRGHGKGKGTKGTSKSQCSPEEIRHAAQLNAWRESEDLPRKSPGSVTRAKARSAAYHAAKAAAIDAQGIGPPAVKPPPPPPPPPRERRGERSENAGVAVRLVERDETPLPSQPEASTVVLIERGEVLPREGEESAAFPVHRVKRRVDDHLQGTASRPHRRPHGSAVSKSVRKERLPEARRPGSLLEVRRKSSANRQSCTEWLPSVGYPGTPCLRYPRSWPTSGKRGQLEASQEHDLCFWPEEAIRWCSRLRR